MGLFSINELFAVSKATDWALPHFNLLNAEVLRAVTAAAEAERAPIILAMGPTSIRHIGLRHLAAMVHSVAQDVFVPLALHLDHAKDIELVKEALACGFSSVMFDGSSLPYEDNLRLTAQVAAMAHDAGASAEGEIGIVPTGADAISRNTYTSPDQAVDFVRKTKIDLVAVSVGSSHRMQSQDATLDIPLIQSLAEATQVPLVLHGGSGVVDQDIIRAIPCGLRKINVSTALKQAFMQGLTMGMAKATDMDPLPVLEAAVSSVQSLAAQRIKLCNASGKIV